MCPIQKIVFQLKEGMAPPHKVEISISKSGMYAMVIVGNGKTQQFSYFPLPKIVGECGEDCRELREEQNMNMGLTHGTLLKNRALVTL